MYNIILLIYKMRHSYLADKNKSFENGVMSFLQIFVRSISLESTTSLKYINVLEVEQSLKSVKSTSNASLSLNFFVWSPVNNFFDFVFKGLVFTF